MADDGHGGGDAGASLTYPIRAGEVKKGSHVVIKGHPCKVRARAPRGQPFADSTTTTSHSHVRRSMLPRCAPPLCGIRSTINMRN